MAVQRQVVFVPREGFRVDRARVLLGADEGAFYRMLRDLPYGEWIMWRGVQHVTLSGLRKLAAGAGVELDFQRLGRRLPPVRDFVGASLPERDRE